MITNELPQWLPTANLILRLLAVSLLLAYVIRRHARTGVGEPRWITLEMAAVLSGIILVAGALFQAGWMDLPDWTLVGTGGSVLLALLALLLVAWRN